MTRIEFNVYGIDYAEIRTVAMKQCRQFFGDDWDGDINIEVERATTATGVIDPLMWKARVLAWKPA